ncbi:hypothetical protein LINPERHAP1_LOCUS4206 [Linum perenne]
MDGNQIAYINILQSDLVSKKWNKRLRKETIIHKYMIQF